MIELKRESFQRSITKDEKTETNLENSTKATTPTTKRLTTLKIGKQLAKQRGTLSKELKLEDISESETSLCTESSSSISLQRKPRRKILIRSASPVLANKVYYQTDKKAAFVVKQTSLKQKPIIKRMSIVRRNPERKRGGLIKKRLQENQVFRSISM